MGENHEPMWSWTFKTKLESRKSGCLFFLSLFLSLILVVEGKIHVDSEVEILEVGFHEKGCNIAQCYCKEASACFMRDWVNSLICAFEVERKVLDLKRGRGKSVEYAHDFIV